jgi:predicted homoserine dehydrogenase-like protein
MRRRDALKTAAMGAFAGKALSPTAEAGSRASANDRIGIGMIGVGDFGRANLRQVLKHADAVVAICDVSGQNLDAAVEVAGGRRGSTATTDACSRTRTSTPW